MFNTHKVAAILLSAITEFYILHNIFWTRHDNTEKVLSVPVFWRSRITMIPFTTSYVFFRLTVNAEFCYTVKGNYRPSCNGNIPTTCWPMSTHSSHYYINTWVLSNHGSTTLIFKLTLHLIDDYIFKNASCTVMVLSHWQNVFTDRKTKYSKQLLWLVPTTVGVQNNILSWCLTHTHAHTHTHTHPRWKSN